MGVGVDERGVMKVDVGMGVGVAVVAGGLPSHQADGWWIPKNQ